MKIFHIFFFFSILLFFNSDILAQLDSYDISSYARPELNRQIKEIDAGFNFFNSLTDTPGTDLEHNYNTRLGGNFIGTRFQNDSIYQRTTAWVARASFSFFKETSSRKNAFGFDGDYRYDDRKKKFLNPQQNFRGTHIVLDTDLEFDRYSIDTEEDPINDMDSYLDLSVGFSFGKGRIELVNDAWHAATILEMLADKGLTNTDFFSHDLITDFANEIAEIKNLRNTDFRLERIAELERLVGFFKTRGVSELNSASFYGHLYDAWLFESFRTRFSGTEKYFEVTPGFLVRGGDWFFISNDDQTHRGRPYLGLSYNFNRYQPLSQDWQYDNVNSFSLSFLYDFLINEDDIGPFNNNYLLGFNFSSRNTISYLPNQRTNYSLGGIFNVFHNRNFDEDFEEDGNNTSVSLDLTADFRYYISPQLVWNISGSIEVFKSYNNSSFFDNEFFRNENRINAGIQYYFF